VADREADIRAYLRTWRERVGEDGVIVLGHPHPPWLGFQISQQNIFFHWMDLREAFRRSMDAFFEAALFIMQVAMEEDLDFMSDCAYGTEMTSPELFVEMDLPYLRAYADWTHERGGLFWYHSCGYTRSLVLSGIFNRLGADVLETLAPPPEGDNDLAESRRFLDRSICSKGNLNLGLLRDGTPDEVAAAARQRVEAVSGYAHIHSTADAVLPGTPPENLIAFVQAARETTTG
jgi:uroporphyrinogen-III decarboxylase